MLMGSPAGGVPATFRAICIHPEGMDAAGPVWRPTAIVPSTWKTKGGSLRIQGQPEKHGKTPYLKSKLTRDPFLPIISEGEVDVSAAQVQRDLELPIILGNQDGHRGLRVCIWHPRASLQANPATATVRMQAGTGRCSGFFQKSKFQLLSEKSLDFINTGHLSKLLFFKKKCGAVHLAWVQRAF